MTDRLVVSLALALVACKGGGESTPSVDAAPGDDPGADASPTSSPIGEVPATPQRTGDPEVGYDKLVNAGYVGCGVPYSAYTIGFPPAQEHQLIPGRTGRNVDLPYSMTAFESASGVEVVTPNCLQCHAEYLNGELVIGLGSHTADYTSHVGAPAQLAGALISDPMEKEEWKKWSERMVAISQHIITDTIGVNPADNIAPVLFAHRDSETLAWSEQPILDLPPQILIPVDVPAWWLLKKKNAMFYPAAGRGDQARIMMTASTLCIDSVDEAREIDEYFPDVRSYLLSLEPPKWPWELNADLVSAGEVVFKDHCSNCHGTYGDDEHFPNLVIDFEDVGTDSLLADGGGSQYAIEYATWYNESFYGELSWMAPAPGYMAPPLDGIWATAPYLHNGSVPTLEGILDSSKRPAYFVRSYNSSDYNQAAVGWNYEELEAGHDAEPDAEKKKRIYDTSKVGYGNEGHTYGDLLSEGDRQALLEYLKTI